jgi:hypothetical protein
MLILVRIAPDPVGSANHVPSRCPIGHLLQVGPVRPAVLNVIKRNSSRSSSNCFQRSFRVPGNRHEVGRVAGHLIVKVLIVFIRRGVVLAHLERCSPSWKIASPLTSGALAVSGVIHASGPANRRPAARSTALTPAA